VETPPKVSATSLRGIPRSTAASILSLRSFECALMPTSWHDVTLRKALLRRNLLQLPLRSLISSRSFAVYSILEFLGNGEHLGFS
jgi:hypothetical protein